MLHVTHHASQCLLYINSVHHLYNITALDQLPLASQVVHSTQQVSWSSSSSMYIGIASTGWSCQHLPIFLMYPMCLFWSYIGLRKFRSMFLIPETCLPHIYIIIGLWKKHLWCTSIFLRQHTHYSSYLTLLYLINSGSYSRMFKELLLQFLRSLKMMGMVLRLAEYFLIKCVSGTQACLHHL